MNLFDIQEGSRVLIDTNILIYARRGSSPQCRSFIERCREGAIQGVITPFVAAEFCHRRMVQEAQVRGIISSNPAKALAEHPEIIRNLTVYEEDTRALFRGELEMISLQNEDFLEAIYLQKMSGLLTMDSLNLTAAKRLGIKEIATADKAFDLVQEFIVYKPNDLNS